MNYCKIWSDDDLKLAEQTTTLTADLHGLTCPCCKSKRFVKNGKIKGNQRYRCSKCGKHFRSTSGHTVHHLHLKPKVEAYLQCMTEGISLRKTAKKVGISLQTAFRWRHRFLSAMNKQTQPFHTEYSAVSAFQLPFSAKGKVSPIVSQPPITSLIQIDTTGRAQINVLGKYGYSTAQMVYKIEGNTAVSKTNSIPRLLKTDSYPGISAVHSQLIQDLQLLLSQWLKPFCGVASKYLQHYWVWFLQFRQMYLQKSEISHYIHISL